MSTAIEQPLPKLTDYLNLARPDNWFKNIFILPGMLMAYAYFPTPLSISLVFYLFLSLFSTCMITSANYVLNEWLDAGTDRYHPVKRYRSSVQKKLNPVWVYAEYTIIGILGLLAAAAINKPFFYASLSLLIMGFFYNVPPIRTKEQAYVDVLTESINNPIRFILGWYVLTTVLFPPSSILIAYWMGGAFLMACKRFAELRFINNKETAALYRKSFAVYTESSLLLSIFFYALTSSFFLAIFLVKHRIELLITFPLFAFLFAWYLKITLENDSIAQKPEKLYKNWKLVLFILVFFLLFIFLLFYPVNWMHYFLRNNFR